TTVCPSRLTSAVTPMRKSASVYIGLAMGRLLPSIEAKRRVCIEHFKGAKIKPILLRSKRHVHNSTPNRLSGCNQLVENVIGYVDLDDRIPTAHIARGQRSEKPRYLCLVCGVPTAAKLGRSIKLQSYQLCS